MRNVITLGCLVCGIVAWLPCQAAELNSPKGFSLTYPDTWLAVTPEMVQTALNVPPPPAGSGFPAEPPLSALIVGPFEQGHPVRVEVAVTPGPISVDEAGERQYVEGMTRDAAAVGCSISDTTTERVQVGGRPALSVRYILTLPMSGGKVAQRQVVIPVDDENFIITCSALPATFGNHEATFASIIDSMRIRRGWLKLWHGLPLAVRMGIIGGAIGGAVGGVVALFRRRRKPAEPTPTEA